MRRAFRTGLVASLVLLGLCGVAGAAGHAWTLATIGLAPQSTSAACPAPPATEPQYYAPSIPSGGKTVALTFDDGPGASTAAILAILESFHVRATFFNIGVQETEWPQDVRAEGADGFLIGNHTWDHPDMTTLSAAGQAAELDKVIHEQELLAGSAPCVFRPPYGDYDSTSLALARARRMSVWMWSVDTEDWEAEGSGSSYWVNRIISLAESEGGALNHPVVLMHNQGIPMPATVAALPTIIRYFESHGYTFVDLLGRTGPPGSCGTASLSHGRPPLATVLRPGQSLSPGSSLDTPDGQYRLTMQRSDGNLVMYDASGRALWSSRTEGHPGASALMEKGGDFVISSKGHEIWSSRTEGHPGAWLAVQADANVVVYSAKGPLWASGSVDSDLTPGEYLNNSWYLESPNRLCTLNLQRDNNLVLYATNGLPLWYAGTRDATSATVVMQRDGNLVEYSASGKTLWASGTEGYSGASLSVTDYGEVVISWPKGTIWSR
jgi:peptidoglycan/xylan/chitin deacetylase (PgdA/CDA1 family)